MCACVRACVRVCVRVCYGMSRDAAAATSEIKFLKEGAAAAKAEASSLDAEGKEVARASAHASAHAEEAKGALDRAEKEATDVQRRHLAAVIAALEDAADAAATAERFEQAAAIQTELEIAKQLHEEQGEAAA